MTTKAGMTCSKLEQIFNTQAQAARDEGTSFAREVSYVDVVCDISLTRIPLDAKEISFRVLPSPENQAQLSDEVMFSLILAQGSLNSVYLDVPFDSTVEPSEILNTAESAGFGVNLIPPKTPALDSKELGMYCELLRAYGAEWLGSPQSNIRVAPIDAYIEYKLGVAAGLKPVSISTDQMITSLYTETLGMEAMDAVKVVLDEVILKHIGDDSAFEEQILTTAKAVILKDRQYMQARAKILTEGLDQRTPTPNLIRLVSAHTELSIPDAAGLLYELKRGIHTVLDKYLPGPKDKDGVMNSPRQAAFAKMIADMAVAAVGGKAQFDALWGEACASAQVADRINIDRGQVTPGPAVTAVATALNTDTKTGALALIEAALVIGSLFEAGGAVEPAEVAEAKPTQSGIIAIG